MEVFSFRSFNERSVGKQDSEYNTKPQHNGFLFKQFDLWSFRSLVKRKFKLNGKIIKMLILINRVKRHCKLMNSIKGTYASCIISES